MRRSTGSTPPLPSSPRAQGFTRYKIRWPDYTLFRNVTLRDCTSALLGGLLVYYFQAASTTPKVLKRLGTVCTSGVGSKISGFVGYLCILLLLYVGSSDDSFSSERKCRRWRARPATCVLFIYYLCAASYIDGILLHKFQYLSEVNFCLS